MEYNNSNANGIIKHICLNKKISLYIYICIPKTAKKTTKNGFFHSVFLQKFAVANEKQMYYIYCVYS